MDHTAAALEPVGPSLQTLATHDAAYCRIPAHLSGSILSDKPSKVHVPRPDDSETLVPTLTSVFDAVDRPIAAVIAFVLAVVRATVGTIANTVTALFPELHAILDAVTDILAPVIAAIDA